MPLDGAETGMIAFVLRYRCDQLRGPCGERRCQVEIEDVDAGDTRRFLDFEEGVAHLRKRITAFSGRNGAPQQSIQTE